MRKIKLMFLFAALFIPFAHAEIKDYIYDGKEIFVRIKKGHMTTVIFPESIVAVIRGFSADTYIIQRNNKKPNTLELMPTDSEIAEMEVSGISGEDYVLRCVSNDNFYTKLIIHKMVEDSNKDNNKTISSKIDALSESVIENKEADNKPKGTLLNLPSELNLKMTLKGNNLPLKVYLSTVAQVTGLNVITTPDIDAQMTSINLDNIEVWRALKSLLYKFGYGFKVSQQDLIVTEAETRIFNIDMPAVDQTFTDATSNESFADSNNNNNTSTNSQQNQDVRVGTKIYYENTSAKLSLWTDLENNIKSMITPQVGSYSLNKVSGSIIVTDKPGVLDKIGDLVSTINEELSRQQSFEIQIIEVTLSSDHETGIDWNVIAKNLKGINNITAGTNFSAAGFLSGQLLTLSSTGPETSSGTGNGGVAMVLKALDSMGVVNVVSKPSITVSNSFPCVIQEVTSIPYISGTGQTIGNYVTQSNVTTSQVSDGLTMRLEAKIEEKKTVLNISVAVNTLDSMTNVPVGNGLTIQEPQVSTKSISTNVGLEPGKGLILGGLISSTRNKTTEGIPYLDKIPYLGNVFEYRSRSNQKSEMVIIISPKSISRNI